MDVNGDGAIAPATEMFDLAVVANGIDGTLQFYRVPETGDPVLLVGGAVRRCGDERRAGRSRPNGSRTSALGARGLAIVDLDGPASVQPIDEDRNGGDDRVLEARLSPRKEQQANRCGSRPRPWHRADAPGHPGDCSAFPPRTKFLTLKRDPVRERSGDEESILESRRAFTSDDEIQVSLSAIAPSQRDLLLVIEQPASGPASGGHSPTEPRLPGSRQA